MRPVCIYTIRWLDERGREQSTLTDNAMFAQTASDAGARVTAEMVSPSEH